MSIQNIEDRIRIQNDPARHLTLPLPSKFTLKIGSCRHLITAEQAKRIRSEISNFLRTQKKET